MLYVHLSYKKVSPLLCICISTSFRCAYHLSPSWGLLFLPLTRKLLFSTWFTQYYKYSQNESDDMKSLSPVEGKTLKIKCPLHSWFSSCVNDGYGSVGKKVYVQYCNKMQMIPFTKERQTYCIIFSVLMVIGAIKLIVRPKRTLLFKNKIAKILVHNQWSKYIRRPKTEDILYCKMDICSDFVLLHNNIRACIGKHCLQRITLHRLLVFSDACSRNNLIPSLKEPV